MKKTWNVRDQPKDLLDCELTRKYKEIDAAFRILRKISNAEDAKKIIDEIWLKKSCANEIEMELLRREYNNGETQ